MDFLGIQNLYTANQKNAIPGGSLSPDSKKEDKVMKNFLKDIRYTKNLSKDTLDITDRILNT